ncbi:MULTISPECIES: hypothetical protein [Halorussus]|uniref:hypothetical protein n=1 Tax=Halorussus TaxID=1070314 RepID=UPI0020A130FE|nr:hypothetical protein [Halorussus vallis]USZ76014.1 hypothetical protein NGM07_01515 [Halorussus vallis]
MRSEDVRGIKTMLLGIQLTLVGILLAIAPLWSTSLLLGYACVFFGFIGVVGGLVIGE